MRSRALGVLLFCSGLAALVLEVAWFRRLAQVSGVTAVALGAALAAVVGGMAAGSLLFGRRADRSPSPLRLYGLLEAGVTLAALVSPWVLDALGPVHVALHRGLLGLPALHLAAAFLVSALVLTPATALMGGTLPAVAAAVDAPDGRRGRALGILYGVNTLGAVVGALLAGFVLLPTFGLQATMRIAAVASGAAAVGALLLARGAVPRPAAEAPRAPRFPPAARRRALVLCAASGFLGLACEVTFSRALVLVFGGTTYAFTTVLAVFLLGIGAGGLIGARLARGDASLRRLETVVGATAAAFALGSLAVFLLPRLYMEGYLRFGSAFLPGLLLRGALATLVLLPGALGLGIAFPLGLDVATEDEPGRGTGRLYAANAFSSVAGSTCAVFLLVPWLGPHGGTLAVSIAVAGLVVVTAPSLRTFVPLAAALVALVPVPRAAWERLNSGVYFNPSSWTRDGQVQELWWEAGADLPFVRDGRESTIAIANWQGRTNLLVNGKSVASDETATDVEHLVLLGHIPMLSHPDPQRVLIVGLGMGMTYRSVEKHAPASITVVELEEAVAEAAGRLGAHPRHIVFTDARAHLAATDDVYDVITSDPIHPWVRGAGDLYTREYFERCRAHLAPDGVMCQWLPLYQMGVDDLRDVVRTFCNVFRGSAYWTGSDLMLVGGPEHVPAPTRDAPNDAVQADLESLDATNLLDLRCGTHDTLVAAAGEGPVLTDDALRLEFSTPRQFGDPELGDCLAWVGSFWEDPQEPYRTLRAAEEARSRGEGFEVSDLLDELLPTWRRHGFVRRFAGEFWLRSVLPATAPGETHDAELLLAAARDMLGDDPRLLDVEADMWLLAGDLPKARATLAKVIARDPGNAWLRRRAALLEQWTAAGW